MTSDRELAEAVLADSSRMRGPDAGIVVELAEALLASEARVEVAVRERNGFRAIIEAAIAVPADEWNTTQEELATALAARLEPRVPEADAG